MDNLPERLAVLIDTIESMPDVDERIMALIEYADRFEEVPPWIAKRPFSENHRVPFCESEAYVWLSKQEDRTIKLYFAVENPAGLSAKALAVILDESLSGLRAEEIAHISPEVAYRIFGENLSMGKGQGLAGMIALVKAEAKILAAARNDHI
jgi:cysteine desulfuration protein SufE